MQRLTLYATLGCLLDALEQGWDTWGFWCILALFMASEHLTRVGTIEQLNRELQAMRAQAKQNKDTQ